MWLYNLRSTFVVRILSGSNENIRRFFQRIFFPQLLSLSLFQFHSCFTIQFNFFYSCLIMKNFMWIQTSLTKQKKGKWKQNFCTKNSLKRKFEKKTNQSNEYLVSLNPLVLDSLSTCLPWSLYSGWEREWKKEGGREWKRERERGGENERKKQSEEKVLEGVFLSSTDT